MFWSGNQRGHLADAITQTWVRLTGKRFEATLHPWLTGPVGDSDRIGEDFFARLASRQGLSVRAGAGLLVDMSALLDGEARQRIDARVAEFYQDTSQYRVDAWSSWSRGFKPFGRILAAVFSRRLEQLNVPLNDLDTSRGLTSRILDIVGSDGRAVSVAWIRTLKSTSQVVYCGAYSTCTVPGFRGNCLKVSFPLPNGNATVILWPSVQDDGSLVLTSRGSRFGDPGFYFVLRHGDSWFARYVVAMRELIHVYAGAEGEVRTDHDLQFYGRTFLRLHYRLARFVEKANKE